MTLDERVLAALETSIKALTQVPNELRDMCHRYEDLEKSLGNQMEDLEDEMRTMNSHLDNLVRETQITNQLLSEDMAERKRVQDANDKADAEERDWKRKMEEKKLAGQAEESKDFRDMAKKAATELWTITKQPLGFLLAGIIAWILINHFVIPQISLTSVTVPSGNTSTTTTTGE
jgi:TolA-binding protein